MGDVVIPCKLTAEGLRTPISKRLSCLIQDAPYGWVAPLQNPDEIEVKVHCDGDILSQSLREKCQCDDVFKKYPGAVAIETEGEGLYAAAYDANIEWVIVKGVASYFHRSQSATSEWLSFASTMAASMVAKMLKDPTVFREWPHYNQAAELASRVAVLSLPPNGAVTADETADETKGISILPLSPFHVTRRREREIQKICEAFDRLKESASGSLVSGVFVKGPPGCGKTQLARQFGEEYIKRVENGRRKIVATLNARSAESFLESYKELHEQLKIRKHSVKKGDIRERIKTYTDDIKSHLRESCCTWLIIVDNLTINDPLRDFWPAPGENSLWGKGRVLVTTQDSDLAPIAHANAEVIGLDSGMTEEDALHLLSDVSLIKADDDAKGVARVLGYYPLSLACAAVYVRQMTKDRSFSKFSWKNYEEIFQENVAGVDHSNYAYHNTCYPQSMLQAAELAARRMAENKEVLRAAFVFLSYCALQPVPLDTVGQYVLRLAGASGDGKTRGRDDVKRKIASCSLLIYPETGERGIEVVTLHQVMRCAFSQIRQRPDKKSGSQLESSGNDDVSEERQERNGVLQTLNTVYHNIKGNMKKDAIAMRIILSPHLKEFIENPGNDQDLEKIDIVEALVYRADSLVHVAGSKNNSCVALLERAYCITKELEREDLRTCGLRCDLGYSYREAGKLDKAKSVLEEAYRLCEEHTETEWMKLRCRVLNILGFTFREMFQLDKAKEYMKRSVDVTKITFGKNHVEVGKRLCNLGIILHDRWENDKAMEVLEEAKSIVEASDTSELFIRAQVLNYTAKVHLRWYLGLRFTHPREPSTRKHLEESDTLHSQALEIYMEHHGDQQKFTNGVMMTYGTAKLHLGDIKQAQEMCEKAVQVYRDSGHIAWPRAGTFLADIFLVRKEYSRAKEFLEEIVKAHDDMSLNVSPGAYHPRALLAEAYANLGNVESAKQILKQLLEEWKEKGMHSEHYWVARARAFIETLKSREEDVVEFARGQVLSL
ncbi:uncharacterized protein [Acropora muricata]